ncbi:hypothetical protein [Duganella vulcania]|uniref:Lipoprotein n=1 Tax=Duganella vulcania TaxID=2692166 RepID=A0A845GIE1_9BURK|nr:hypothetical protein [Duganella vulcania]MYM92828.1 hypothetical protein [Duganella vulcania]
MSLPRFILVIVLLLASADLTGCATVPVRPSPNDSLCAYARAHRAPVAATCAASRATRVAAC